MVDIEDRLRRVLSEHTGHVSASAQLGARIEEGLGRRLRLRRLAVSGTAIVVAACVAAAILIAVSRKDHALQVVTRPPASITGAPLVTRPPASITAAPPVTRSPASIAAAPLVVLAGGWATIQDPPFPEAFASVWTGTQLIVVFRPPGPLKFASFDPGTGRWQELPDTPLPLTAPFTDWSTFAWTGTQLLVWGYQNPGPDTFSGSLRLLGYRPDTRRWSRLADPPIHGLIQAHPIWTGTEMIVWGGNFNGAVTPAQGDAYDPARNTWRPIPPGPLSIRENPMIVWTGREMIVWGGLTAEGLGGQPLSAADRVEGAAYKPATNTWRALPASGLPAIEGAAAAWTGTEMIVSSPPATGKAYNPATNRWRPIAPSPLSSRELFSWTWTGRQLIVWGGIAYSPGRQTLADGAAYDPAADRWKPLPPAPIGSRRNASMGWTGQVAIIIGGDGPSNPGASDEPPADHAAAYRPAST